MEKSENSYYKCLKCYREIVKINKLLHDQYCFNDTNDNNDNEANNNNSGSNNKIKSDHAINLDVEIPIIQNNPKKNQIKNTNIDYPSLDDINLTSDAFNYPHKEDIKYCPKCDNYFNTKEFDDHMLSHKIDEENYNNNEINNENVEENDYDLLEDKNELLREFEEDEAFKRKFEMKKNQKNKGNSNIANKVIDYLFETKHRTVPPIVRIVGAIFDRNQLAYLAADEVASRVIDQIVDDKPKVTEDDKIFLELIPETEIKTSCQIPEEKKNCIICLSSFEIGEIVTTLPCLHIYHSECIKDWFKSNSTCPVCKYEITSENFK